jgi:uncharacterized protein (TIGR00369 family)
MNIDKDSLHAIALQELAKVFEKIPFNRMLGLQLDTVADDHIVMSFKMKDELIGNFLHGILHGGVISSVLDMAGGVAAMIAAMQKHSDKSLTELAGILGKSSTIDLHINYLLPGKGDHFIAKAWVQQAGNRITFTRMELLSQDKLIASASGTYLVG